ncbi:hypothetical protein [Nonomuraea longicatena]|uniref:V8-like Glu-specific endopeptidase n=1 Tax=Nonomuraea longicatena TaxID=83682 RepID=A0ABN1PK60_9ACTN
MLRLMVSLALLPFPPPLAGPPQRSVPVPRVLTPGGDRLGYAPAVTTRPEVGVLVGRDPIDGREIVCGGSVVRSRSRSLVLTAAHCLYHRGRLLERLEFTPGFQGAGSPLGAWSAVHAWVPARWRERPGAPSRLPYDVALVGVARKGRTLGEVAGGGLRPLTGRSGARSLDLLGYPAGRDYPGTRLYHCLARTAPYRGVLVTHNCHAAGGGSGGPAVRGGGVAAVVSSSSPLSDPDGFTVLAPLDSRAFRRMLVRAETVMREEPR